jgi:carbamoyltransferase
MNTKSKKPVWIAGIARGHNAGACLLKDGEIVFSIEEERLSRYKYDGGPYASILKILEYTDKIDYLVVAHTQSLEEMKEMGGRVDYSGDDIYTGLCRKVGLIDQKHPLGSPHPQVVDLSRVHHKLHAGLAFYRSGFEEAVAVVVDGAGTFIPLSRDPGGKTTGFEVESIYECNYPANIKTVFKHIAVREPMVGACIPDFTSEAYSEEGTHEVVISDTAGITKVYEAVTSFCGFHAIEAGKTMGLFPYGKPNSNIPNLFTTGNTYPVSNRNLIIPNYPNGAWVNEGNYEELTDRSSQDLTKLQNRRDMAYACQMQTQEQVVKLIRKAVKDTGRKNVVISGGYGLNCVANYYYLEALKDDGINLYCEPVSSDAGTAMGAALTFWRALSDDSTVNSRANTLYLGPEYHYTEDDITAFTESHGAVITDATHADIVELLEAKTIVSMFQGRSENGPRALGNRSILFDPRFKDGKEFVNGVKNREYFRPFAGSILQEHVHEWFDLRGMDDSPVMMYAVNCQPGIAEKIPSIIHVDGTCRIQTVTQEQNKHYYDLIKTFYDKTGCPIIFNTSFNLGGDPLVETLFDAMETLAQSEIEYLYLPEYGKLVKIANK